jgi:chromosome segregation ATPase
VYQWYGQTLQRTEIQKLEQTVYQKSAAMQDYAIAVKNMDRQIAQMDARITELKAQSKTNADLVVTQKREIIRLQGVSETLTNEVAQYKTGIAALEGKLKDAYDGIQTQNEAVKEIVAQRDELVKKLNDSVTDRNEVVNKYNDLVRQVEKSQK